MPFVFPTARDPIKAPDPHDAEAGTHVEAENTRANAVLSRAARTAIMPPQEDLRRFVNPEQMRFIELQETPRYSREQGVGKSPGMRMPWRNLWVSLIDKRLKQMPPIRTWRELPSRPEQQGWSAAYLLYFEQRTRHVWPGGSSQPGRVIEHPESTSLTAIARGFGVR
jgi:hypothetical protein